MQIGSDLSKLWWFNMDMVSPIDCVSAQSDWIDFSCATELLLVK